MHLYAIMLEVLLQELASVDAVSRPDQVPALYLRPTTKLLWVDLPPALGSHLQA
jgi:hypothetical protein